MEIWPVGSGREENAAKVSEAAHHGVAGDAEAAQAKVPKDAARDGKKEGGQKRHHRYHYQGECGVGIKVNDSIALI